MKHIIKILLLSLLLANQQTEAQDSTKIKSFREKLLPQYIVYFNAAKLTEKGLLELYAVDKYIQSSAIDKKRIMSNITASWSEPLILIRYGDKIELWGWDVETKITKLLDECNLNPSLHPSLLLKSQEVKPHLPWFFYVGYTAGFSKGNTSFAFNSRLGCFMFDHRWDGALIFSFGFTGVKGTDTTIITPNYSFGIMCRKRFIIPNSKLTPNIGLQLMHTYDGSTSSTDLSIILGLSWFVGIGTIDFDLSIGNSVNGMGGYTVSPSMMKR